jgi:hypothetical protein
METALRTDIQVVQDVLFIENAAAFVASRPQVRHFIWIIHMTPELIEALRDLLLFGRRSGFFGQLRKIREDSVRIREFLFDIDLIG